MPSCPEPAAQPGRGRRLLLLALAVAVVVSFPASTPVASAERPTARPPPGAQAAGRVPALWMPLAGPLVRGFEAPVGPYGPGHRGIDIAGPAGQAVRAPGAGRVVFAGPVAGTTWLTLPVAPGVLVTLGPLLDPAAAAGRPMGHGVAPPAAGDRVRARASVGRLASGHGGARMGRGQLGATLHLSVRVDGVYVDPLAYLVDRPRPRLAPLLAPGGLPRA